MTMCGGRATGGSCWELNPWKVQAGALGYRRGADPLPGPPTLGVGSPTLFLQQQNCPSPTPYILGFSLDLQRGAPPPSLQGPAHSMARLELVPSGGQPGHACLPGPRFVFSCPCPSGEVKCPGSHPLGQSPGPRRERLPLPHHLPLDSL